LVAFGLARAKGELQETVAWVTPIAIVSMTGATGHEGGFVSR
jgi:hypothetical protein